MSNERDDAAIAVLLAIEKRATKLRSVLPSHAIESGAACQFGAPGTLLAVLFAA